MASRLELHEELCKILGTRNVYFQPPESIKIVYPCFIYNLSKIEVTRADDQMYLYTNQYDLTYIDKNPDSEIPVEVLKHFRLCSHNRMFTADNLNHNTFTLYY